MRRPVLVTLGYCAALTLALPVGAGAQAPAAPAAAPAAAQAAAPAADADADTRSLFDETWNQFQLGGRLSHIDGDPARFQRYQDVRNGVLFTNARFSRDDPGGLWQYRVTADNVGYRDQRFSGAYQRTGRFVISGLWDEIPQFYSVDSKTPYTMSGSPLRLDDATQRLIQGGQATLSAYVPIAPQFDLRERRDLGRFDMVATPTPQIDVKASFSTTRHRGELPWGGSFGFSNDVEVALPYDSRTNDLNVGTEWTNSRTMLRVAYDGSWFNNLDPTLVWDSPLALTDASGKPGSGQMQLWPTNSAHTVSGAGYTKFAHKTQLTGAVSFGFWNNDQPLLPFTTNTALPTTALPRASAQAEARVFSGNLNLVSHPRPEWAFSGRLREYSYDNRTAPTTITDYVSYDSSINTSSTLGPRLYAHNRTTFDADATYSRLRAVALTAGYTFNGTGYDSRIFDSASENVLRLSADAVGTSFMTLHAKYEYGSRTGSGLNEALLVQIGEQPAMRYYDLANRSRNQFTGIVDFVPNDTWTFSLSGGVGKDNYPDSVFGLQETTFRTFSTGADFHVASGFGGGGTYNFERYGGLQQSRSADASQFNDPSRNWSVDTAENVNYFSLYATPPRFGRNTEARVSYDFSYAKGSYLYAVVPGGPLPPPAQLPDVYNKLQQLHVDVRHRVTRKLAATFSYLFEPFRVYDFAFDPSVVNGIVQPSSLVLGYVYRPYTVNSFNFGLRYLW